VPEATGKASAAQIVDRGANYRTWQRVIDETLPNGTVIQRSSSYIEMAVGMHFIRDGQWMESKEEIELFKDGAIARQGAHQVIFAPKSLSEKGSSAIARLDRDLHEWRIL